MCYGNMGTPTATTGAGVSSSGSSRTLACADSPVVVHCILTPWDTITFAGERIAYNPFYIPRPGDVCAVETTRILTKLPIDHQHFRDHVLPYAEEESGSYGSNESKAHNIFLEQTQSIGEVVDTSPSDLMQIL